MRHKDKAILYWFGPLESKTLRPVLRLYCWRGEITWRPVDGLLVVYVGCPREDALARLILGDGQGRWTEV
jgi:hypothetical protein